MSQFKSIFWSWFIFVPISSFLRVSMNISLKTFRWLFCQPWWWSVWVRACSDVAQQQQKTDQRIEFFKFLSLNCNRRGICCCSTGFDLIYFACCKSHRAHNLIQVHFYKCVWLLGRSTICERCVRYLSTMKSMFGHFPFTFAISFHFSISLCPER